MHWRKKPVQWGSTITNQPHKSIKEQFDWPTDLWPTRIKQSKKLASEISNAERCKIWVKARFFEAAALDALEEHNRFNEAQAFRSKLTKAIMNNSNGLLTSEPQESSGPKSWHQRFHIPNDAKYGSKRVFLKCVCSRARCIGGTHPVQWGSRIS